MNSLSAACEPREVHVDGLKRLANKRDAPYQSLLKIYLTERLAIEQQKFFGPGWLQQPQL